MPMSVTSSSNAPQQAALNETYAADPVSPNSWVEIRAQNSVEPGMKMDSLKSEMLVAMRKTQEHVKQHQEACLQMRQQDSSKEAGDVIDSSTSECIVVLRERNHNLKELYSRFEEEGSSEARDNIASQIRSAIGETDSRLLKMIDTLHGLSKIEEDQGSCALM